MADGRFVSYLRVSTSKQGQSGLGIEAQRQAVMDRLNGGAWTLLSEFVEVESGRRADRPEFEKALAMCRSHRASLIVAKVDRLARSQGFLSRVLDSGVSVWFCDLPNQEGPVGRFMVQQMMAVAELEAGFIAARTKAALAAAKANGKKLGGRRKAFAIGTPETAAIGRAARTRRANARAADLAPVLDRLDPAGTLSLRALAEKLTAEGVPTPRNASTWTPATVARLRQRLSTTAA